MSNVKDIFSGIFGFLAMVFWLGAIIVLGWQVWGWISTGQWTTRSVGGMMNYMTGGMPHAGGLYGIVAVDLIAQLSLALVLALLGLACNGLNKALGG